MRILKAAIAAMFLAASTLAVAPAPAEAQAKKSMAKKAKAKKAPKKAKKAKKVKKAKKGKRKGAAPGKCGVGKFYDKKKRACVAK
jgi:Ni/Co efflux regulator RcnB